MSEFLVNGEPLSFAEWPKIPRLSRGIVITEKIDGTNAQVIIDDNCDQVAAASRSRLITPEDDNYGFAGWVQRNKDELFKLGPGRHFGEWWGAGIQRKYGISEKRFSLFNTGRWHSDMNVAVHSATPTTCHEVPVCHVVPVLYLGVFTDTAVDRAISMLQEHGSYAANKFNDPEGIVVYHSASKTYFKKTVKNDQLAKGEQ
jgi:hypothetical protein